MSCAVFWRAPRARVELQTANKLEKDVFFLMQIHTWHEKKFLAMTEADHFYWSLKIKKLWDFHLKR